VRACPIGSAVEMIFSAFHKVQWRHFSDVVDRFKNTYVFLQDSVYQKLFISVYFQRSYSKNKNVITFWGHSVDIASYSSKVANFSTPRVFCAAVWVTCLEFYRGFWHQKSRIPVLSMGVCVMIFLSSYTDTRSQHIAR